MKKAHKILQNLLYPRKRIAGLDIGTSSVKIMEFEGDSLENAKLIKYAVEPIPPNLNNSDQLQNIEFLAETVRKCWKKSGITTKYVSIALTNASIISKKVVMPIFDDDLELNIHANNEIGKYLPSGITPAEVTLDYAPIQINAHSDTDCDMMLIAAKKEKIEEKIAIVEAAGLIPVILDVEQYSFQNMLRLMKGEDFNHKTYLLIDASATTLKLLIFRKGEMIFSRDANIGGINLTKDIMHNLSKDYMEAEQIKIEKLHDDTYEIVEKSFLNNYVSEFINAFQYFVSSNPITEVDEMIITGGVAGLANIEEAFKNIILEYNETNIKTEPYIAKPLHNMPKDEKIDLIKFLQDEPSLFLVTSLALRPFLRQY